MNPHQNWRTRHSTLRLLTTLCCWLAFPGSPWAQPSRPKAPAKPAEPASLHAALALPGWLTLTLEHRARVETLSNQFRPDAPRHDSALALRTLLFAEARLAALRLGAEFSDSRHLFTRQGAPLNNTLINPLEPLQMYVGGELQAGPTVFDFRLGRQTVDLGSRRLLARNRYRNTINAFLGAHASLRLPAAEDQLQHQVELFALSPTERLPDEERALVGHHVELDAQLWGTWLFGAHYLAEFGRTTLSSYALYLHEQDTQDTATLDRRLLTPGLRWLTPPSPGDFDGEAEVAGQWGRLSASRDPDAMNLSHWAHLVHLRAGFTLDVPTAPNLALVLDLASGDADPQDDSSQRFDTLFGARRFDFGPTGIYGPFARSNLRSVGSQLTLTPGAGWSGFVFYRSLWLDEATDAWTTTGLRDPTGSSGRFLGNQVEMRVRYVVIPDNLELEGAFAQFWLGRFATTVPDAAGRADPTYASLQLVVSL